MTAIHVFAVGKVNGNRDIVIVPACAPDITDAYAIGEMDSDDGKPCEPLNYFSDLIAIEAYIVGYKAKLAPLQDFIDACAVLDAHVPPTREQRQDEAAHQADTEAFFRHAKREASDYEDYLADIDWLRHGC